MNNVTVIVVAILAVAAMLLLRSPPQSQGAYTLASAPQRRNCPPKPYYARSERQDARWQWVEPESEGAVTTAYRYREYSDE